MNRVITLLAIAIFFTSCIVESSALTASAKVTSQIRVVQIKTDVQGNTVLGPDRNGLPVYASNSRLWLTGEANLDGAESKGFLTASRVNAQGALSVQWGDCAFNIKLSSHQDSAGSFKLAAGDNEYLIGDGSAGSGFYFNGSFTNGAETYKVTGTATLWMATLGFPHDGPVCCVFILFPTQFYPGMSPVFLWSPVNGYLSNGDPTSPPWPAATQFEYSLKPCPAV
jgi:hypothetical protein